MAGNRTRAAALLVRAADIVDGARRETHGTPERSFETIAALWGVYLAHHAHRYVRGGRTPPLDAVDVAHMMTLLKIARSLHGRPTEDHFLDAAAYCALAGELELLGTEAAEVKP